PRSQAELGNARPEAPLPVRTPEEAELPGLAFPSGAWERETLLRTEDSGPRTEEPELSPQSSVLSPPLWSAALVAGWFAGLAAWCGLARRRVVRFRRLLAFADPAPAWLREEVDRRAARLGLRRGPGVWLVPGRLAPMLWSLGGPPRLLVPAGLLDA